MNKQQEAQIEALARQVRRSLINPNIKGISRVLKEVGGKDQSLLQFQALIEVAYWQLADVVDGGRVRRCEASGCGAVFIQKDRRQRFCPPRFAQQESPCAIRERVGNFRQPKPPKATNP